MTSKLKFGNGITAVLRGEGRGRTVTLFDYSTVPAGHLVAKLTSADINRGMHFKSLTLEQNCRLGKWLNAHVTYKATPAKGAAPDHVFPKERDVLHQFFIWTQEPDCRITCNDDGEISHPDVTKWYVAKYCRENHLTM